MTRAEASRWAVGVLYVVAGGLHLLAPEPYLQIVPPGYPRPGLLVAVSGLAEIAGGLGVLSPWPPLRRAAGWGLVALLVAVYPANVYAALTLTAPAGLLWWRLPLQGVLVAWVLHAAGLLAPPPRYSASKVPGHANLANSRE